jgi:hypothetical protein
MELSGTFTFKNKFPSLQEVVENYDLYIDYSGDERMTRERFAAGTPEARARRLWAREWASGPGRLQEDCDYFASLAARRAATPASASAFLKSRS